jgi:hypothetical protein
MAISGHIQRTDRNSEDHVVKGKKSLRLYI